MRRFFLTAVLGIGLGLNLFAQEQFLGIPYEDLQAAASTESLDNAERHVKVICSYLYVACTTSITF